MLFASISRRRSVGSGGGAACATRFTFTTCSVFCPVGTVATTAIRFSPICSGTLSRTNIPVAKTEAASPPTVTFACGKVWPRTFTVSRVVELPSPRGSRIVNERSSFVAAPLVSRLEGWAGTNPAHSPADKPTSMRNACADEVAANCLGLVIGHDHKRSISGSPGASSPKRALLRLVGGLWRGR